MLIDIKLKKNKDNMLHLMSKGKETIKIEDGVYENFHLNFDKELINSGYKLNKRMAYKNLGLSKPYGVCDSYEQFIGLFGDSIRESNRKYVLSYTIIKKSEQSQKGGFRWSMWGPYIGTRTKTSDYLYNEREIDSVCVFALYEISSGPGIKSSSNAKIEPNNKNIEINKNDNIVKEEKMLTSEKPKQKKKPKRKKVKVKPEFRKKKNENIIKNETKKDKRKVIKIT